ncbi:MAG: insulinase family protein, partial [Leptotrichiaceae bacterium]
SQLVSSIGGTDLNAFTSYDSTVFTMNFPSKNIEKAMFLERSRFDNVALREFHTELEAVYEEYNLTENNGFSLVFNKVMAEFFKDKPYSRPTIGVPYDLKNPSIKEIREFFDKYYVANNIAIVLSGNLEYADTIKMIDKYWGNYRSNKEVNTLPTSQSTENYIESKETDIDVPNYSGLYVAVKLPHSEYTTAQIVSMLLYNGLDGVFDKLILDRKLQTVDQDVADFNDGTVHVLRLVGGVNDSMSKTKKVYFEGIKTLKDGKFTEEQLSNIKSKIAKSYDSLKNNSSIITGALEDSFVKGLDLSDEDKQYNIVMNLTKKDIVEFANRVFNNQFIIDAYNSTDIDYEKLDKPEITPLASNPSSESEFAKEFYAMSSKENNFDKSKLESLEIIDLGKGIKLYYVNNKDNNQYDITYIYPLGYVENNNLNMARELFYEIGTKKIQLEKFQNAMSEKSIMIGMSVFSDQTEFSLTGIDSNKANILEALKLFKEKSSNNIATTDQYATFKNNMIKKLQEIKENPEFLTSAAPSYVIFGETSWNRMIKSDIEQLNKKEGNFYADLINSLSTKKPDIFAYTSLS